MNKFILILLLLLTLGIATARTVVIDEIYGTLTNDQYITTAKPSVNITVCCDAAVYSIRLYYNNETTPLNLTSNTTSIANNTNTLLWINNTLSEGIMRLNVYANTSTTTMSVVARRYIDTTSPVVTKIYIPSRPDNLTEAVSKYTFSCSVTEANLNSAWINSTATKKALTCSGGTCTGDYNLSTYALGLNLSTGANAVTCCANDSAANYHCLGMTITHDSTAPVIGANGTIESTYAYLENYGTRINLTFYAQDTNINWSDCYIASTKAVNVTGAASSLYNLTGLTSALFDLDGNCTYTPFDIYCRDKAGNIGNFSIENLTVIPCLENWNSGALTFTTAAGTNSLIITPNATGAVNLTVWMPIVSTRAGNTTCPWMASGDFKYSIANVTQNITGTSYCEVKIERNSSHSGSITISKYTPAIQTAPDLLLPTGLALFFVGVGYAISRITKKKT